MAARELPELMLPATGAAEQAGFFPPLRRALAVEEIYNEETQLIAGRKISIGTKGHFLSTNATAIGQVLSGSGKTDLLRVHPSQYDRSGRFNLDQSSVMWLTESLDESYHLPTRVIGSSRLFYSLITTSSV